MVFDGSVSTMFKGINLLPWRERLRRDHQQRLIRILSVAGLLLISVQGTGYLYFGSQLQLVEMQGLRLKTSIVAVQATLKQQSETIKEQQQLLAQIEIMDSLNQQRDALPQFISVMAKIVPEHVYLTKAQRQRNKVHLFGISESSNGMAVLLEKLQQSPQVSAVQVQSVGDAIASQGGASALQASYQAFEVSFGFQPL
jgi:type IV pilus assembly protein PilN